MPSSVVSACREAQIIPIDSDCPDLEPEALEKLGEHIDVSSTAKHSLFKQFHNSGLSVQLRIYRNRVVLACQLHQS